MIYKCINGFVIFQFEAIQELEMLQNILPLPRLVPYGDKPLTFIPASQSKGRIFIQGQPISKFSVPVISHTNIIEGFKANGFTYDFKRDDIVPISLINNKVEMTTNQFGLYVSSFTLQPYSMVGYQGRATDFEAVFDARKGVYVYSYIRFEYE